MSKSSKQNRYKRRVASRKRNNIKNSKKDNSIACEVKAPIINELSNPFLKLSENQRKEILLDLSNTGKRTVENNIQSINKILKKFNPFELLSIIASYGLSIGFNSDGIKDTRSKAGVEQVDVEILQALLLQVSDDEIGGSTVTPDIVQETIDMLVDIRKGFSFSRLNNRFITQNQSDKAISKIQEKLMGHTHVVRNWGYHHQIKNISRELYRDFDPLLESKLGFSATNIIDIFEAIIIETEYNLTKRFENISSLFKLNNKHKIIAQYFKIIELEEESVNDFYESRNINKISKENLIFMFINHYDQWFTDKFYIDIEEISKKTNIYYETVEKVVEQFSKKIGSLRDKKTEHLFLDNPIWTKPVISHEGSFFCVLPQAFFSFIFQSIDELIESLDKKSLHLRRANFLECKIEEIVKKRFPESKVIPSLTWKFDGEKYETDLVAFIDSHMIIIEAKSNKISNAALRGAPKRIKRHLDEILIKPSIQSYRLEKRIDGIKKDGIMEDDLIKSLPVNIDDIHKIIRVSVTLEDFATLQSNLSLFEETGWLPDSFKSCPSMNLADFDTLFDLLEHPVQIIHYLTRRVEMEKVHSFIGDELDFMGLYVMNLFNDLGSSDKINFISEMSDPIDKYYISKGAGINTKKPIPKYCKWFDRIFLQLELRSTSRWSEIGVLLGRFSPTEQNKIEKSILSTKKNVMKNWHVDGHINSLIYYPSKSSDLGLVVSLYKNENKQERYNYVESSAFKAFEKEHINQCLVIGVNIDFDNAYDLIALMDRSERLDSDDFL